MGIVTFSKKKFDIPTKAPFADKLIREYKEGIEERKQRKNKELHENLIKEDPQQPEEKEDNYDSFVSSHDKKFFATSFTKFN
jgi:hypothetical protein